MQKILLPLLIASLLMITHISKGQGCSDAGLCTIGHVEDSSSNNFTRFSISPSFGLGEGFVNIFSPLLDVEQKLGKFRLAARIPYHFAFAKAYSASDLGDITLSLGYNFLEEKIKGSATAGVKLPTGSNDIMDNGVSLPMAFQSGLGSTDLILAINITEPQKWAVGIAYQHPLEQDMRNEFLPSLYIGVDDFLVDFYPSRSLERAADFMLRGDKYFSGDKWNWRAGFISVYHLKKDSYLNINDERVELEDSKGLTLNLNAGMLREISEQMSVEILLGFPVYARDDRPDGLTRNLVLLPKLSHKL